MSRKDCIHDDDQVFAPQEEPLSDSLQQLLICLPFIAFLLAGYVWMFLDIFQ